MDWSLNPDAGGNTDTLGLIVFLIVLALTFALLRLQTSSGAEGRDEKGSPRGGLEPKV